MSRRLARMLRRWRDQKAVLVLASVLMILSLPAQAAEPSREDRIKAAIVYKVGKFVDWPETAFSASDAPLQLCLLGDDGFAHALSGVEGRAVQGRRIELKVVTATAIPRVGDCHILFLPRSASGRATSVVRRLAGAPVLTISDIPGFARSGGMIALVRNGNRISFEIDPRAANASGLVMRAQLLDLSKIVEP